MSRCEEARSPAYEEGNHLKDGLRDFFGDREEGKFMDAEKGAG